jgi:4'-phosphopantetheinyl transferase
MPDFMSSPWAPSPERIELTGSEIHVWRAFLDRGEAVLRQFEATLSSDEKARATRFSYQADRNVYVATRGVLREVLGRYIHRSPAELEFDYSPRGKPFLRRGSLELPVDFNVSHSHGVALLGFAVGRQLGIDVELVRPNRANDDVAERYFSPREVAELRALPLSLRVEGFFRCWTRKEAYIKARGEGLRIPLESFSVGLTPGQPERLESADSDRWSLCSVNPGPTFAAALVGEGSGWQVRAWNWNSPAVDDRHGIQADSI